MTVKIEINIAEQSLLRYDNDEITHRYSISSAKNGIGSESGSEKTPLGEHIIRAKIGADEPENAVFIGRRPTGEIYNAELAEQYPNRDWILTRILWLSGKEVGDNRLGNVDSMRRYIYIHGTPETEPMGKPLSHGCIRMRNRDMIELFNLVPIYCPVLIKEA